MTRDEIVTALRCCASIDGSGCGICPSEELDGKEICCGDALKLSAADLIENQQRHIEALMKANDSLKATVLRRDAQIDKMSADLLEAKKEIEVCHNSANQLDATNSGLMSSNMKLAADRKALINELCQYCGKYKYAHEGACDGCKWRDM